MVIGHGDTTRFLSDADVRRIVADGFARAPIDGKRVLVLIPDATRTMPMPLMFDVLAAEVGPRVAALDYLVALGTHQPMSDEQLSRLVGRPVVDGVTGRSRVFNHRWDLDGTFARLGTIPAAEIAELSGGLLQADVPVSLNKLLLDYDHLVICGPVFPHEVVGFSGGTKYLVPGMAGPDIINFTHWLGAVITSSAVIGAGYTPVRAVIDRAAAMVDRPMSCISLVVTHDGIAGLYVGPPGESWAAASALSARTHVHWVDRPFTRVLSVMPTMYDDLWTAAKGMYKLEPAMADGGEIVIFAPHITEVSYTHGRIIDEIGYHCRDYFLAQWDRFGHYPGGVLAHSTHVQGPRHLRRRDGRGAAAHPGDAGHGHPRGAVQADQPRLPRPGRHPPGRLERARSRGRHRRAARRRNAVPPVPGGHHGSFTCTVTSASSASA